MEDVVSKFIVGTCRVLPKFNTNVFDSMNSYYDKQCLSYSIRCGSCSEFFIQPLQPCFGDFDYFEIKYNLLAFTEEKPVVPYDLRHTADKIYCLLMEPYLDYPGFVRLRHLGLMCYNWESKAFEYYVQPDVQRFLITTEMEEADFDDHYGTWYQVGPAIKCRFFETASITTDRVAAIWCPQWPSEAKQWPTRKRKYAWPTTAIIQEVVQHGCHVIYAKHPACRNDEYQCRLSFSVAEVILLQSWTSVQQIVYHMLRFFAKRELINKDCPKEDEILCTYHFKTLMLWSCEEISPELWNSLSVIELCCNLLEMLIKWLEDAKCPNYFISQANMFHDHFDLNIVDETVNTITSYCDSNILSLWFVEHYMQSGFLVAFDAKCTVDVLSREYLVQTCEALKAIRPKSIDHYVSVRFNKDLEYRHQAAAGKVLLESYACDILKYCMRIDSPCKTKLDFLPSAEYESCYRFFGSMLRLLQGARLIGLQWEGSASEIYRGCQLIKTVSEKTKFMRSRYHHLPKPFDDEVENSLLFFLTALDVMENLTGSSDHLEFKMMSEISKVLLTWASEYKDSKSNALAKANLSYLAALHFSASEYEIARDCCSRVIVIERVDENETETLNASCLLYIENISNIVGFYLIFIKIKAALYYTRRQFFLDLRLAPEVFAQYLRMLAIERIGGVVEPFSISPNPKYPLDAILTAITNHICAQISERRKNVLCVYKRNKGTDVIDTFKNKYQSYSFNEEHFIHLLVECSLENMTSFYNAICQDFDIHCSTVDCYRAAYLHRCGKYREVLALCERILNEPCLRSDLKELAFANVMVLPPLDLIFDTDVQCLLGIQTLAYYLLLSNEDFWEREEAGELLTLQNIFAQHIHVSKLRHTLSRVLTEPYILKCHYYLGRYFLARYLKVRCLMDCNTSLSEVLSEFKKLKACLPFEQLMCCILKQKLWQLYPKLLMLRLKYFFNCDQI